MLKWQQMSAEVKGTVFPPSKQKKISLPQNHSHESKVIIWLFKENFRSLFTQLWKEECQSYLHKLG